MDKYHAVVSFLGTVKIDNCLDLAEIGCDSYKVKATCENLSWFVEIYWDGKHFLMYCANLGRWWFDWRLNFWQYTHATRGVRCCNLGCNLHSSSFPVGQHAINTTGLCPKVPNLFENKAVSRLTKLSKPSDMFPHGARWGSIYLDFTKRCSSISQLQMRAPFRDLNSMWQADAVGPGSGPGCWSAPGPKQEHQKECQIECWNIEETEKLRERERRNARIYVKIECQKERRNRCQIGWECHKKWQNICQKVCQNRRQIDCR